MAQCALQPGISAVATSESELGKQSWDTLRKNGSVVPASLVTERAG